MNMDVIRIDNYLVYGHFNIYGNESINIYGNSSGYIKRKTPMIDIWTFDKISLTIETAGKNRLMPTRVWQDTFQLKNDRLT